MDIERFGHGDGQTHEFRLLRFVARLDGKTVASAHFSIYKKKPFATYVYLGHIDVHHPCTGEKEAILTVGLPAKHLTWDSRKRLTRQVFRALAIPDDAKFVVHFCPESEN